MAEPEVQYHVPAVPEASSIRVEENELGYDKQMLSLTKGGVMKVRVEEDIVVSRIAHDIYANSRSGFREMYANALTACLNARELFDASPQIRVTINPMTRTLELVEVDSTGISTDVLANIYLVLGRSGNLGGDKLGQYGFGKVAYTTLSDRIYIATRFRTRDGKHGEFALEGRDGREYVLLPKPKLDHFGTTVKMVVNERVNLYSLASYVISAGKFSGVPTTLVMTHEVRGEYGRQVEAGTRELGKTYSEFLNKELGDAKVLRRFLFKEEGFEFAAIIATVRDIDRYYDTDDDEKKRTYILGMPVDAKLEEGREDSPVHPFSRWVLNIKDERKYPPTADRERLKEETQEALMAALVPLVTQAFAVLNFGTLPEYLKAEKKQQAIFLTAPIDPFISQPSVDLKRMLLSDYPVRGSKGKESLLKLMEKTPLDGIVYEERRFDRVRSEKILKHDEKAVIIRASSFAPALGANGFLSAKEYIQKHGLDAVQLPNSFQVYSSKVATIGWGENSRPAKDAQFVASIDRSVIKLPRGERRYLPILSMTTTRHRLTFERPDLEGKGTTLAEFLEQVGEKRVETNRGVVKVKELGKYSNFYLSVYSDPTFARHFARDKETLVFSDPDTIFEVAVFLTANSLEFRVDLAPYEFYRDHLPKKPKNLPWSWDIMHEGAWNLGDSEIVLSALHVILAVENPVLKGPLAYSFRNASAEEATRIRNEILKSLSVPNGQKGGSGAKAS